MKKMPFKRRKLIPAVSSDTQRKTFQYFLEKMNVAKKKSFLVPSNAIYAVATCTFKCTKKKKNNNKNYSSRDEYTHTLFKIKFPNTWPLFSRHNGTTFMALDLIETLDRVRFSRTWTYIWFPRSRLGPIETGTSIWHRLLFFLKKYEKIAFVLCRWLAA